MKELKPGDSYCFPCPPSEQIITITTKGKDKPIAGETISIGGEHIITFLSVTDEGISLGISKQ